MRRLKMFFIAMVLCACATTQPLNQTQSEKTDVAKSVMTALVLEGKCSGARMNGSAVVIKHGDGYTIAVTAAHCYKKGAKYTVKDYRGKTYNAIFYKVSKTDDIGLLWIKGRVGAVAEPGVQPPWGDRVYVIGNKLGGGPFPTDGLYAGRVTRGFARCSAPTHPGNSGGGVYHRGKLIGIVSRIPGMFRKTAPGAALPQDLRGKAKEGEERPNLIPHVHPHTHSYGQIFPSICMYVPVDRLQEFIAFIGGIDQADEPTPLTGDFEAVLPPPPEKWNSGKFSE